MGELCRTTTNRRATLQETCAYEMIRETLRAIREALNTTLDKVDRRTMSYSLKASQGHCLAGVCLSKTVSKYKSPMIPTRFTLQGRWEYGLASTFKKDEADIRYIRLERYRW